MSTIKGAEYALHKVLSSDFEFQWTVKEVEERQAELLGVFRKDWRLDPPGSDVA